MPDALKASLTILFSQLPLVGGGWLWWTDRIHARPLYAALAAGGYEGALLLATFVKKVWKDELEKDAVRVTADWVRGSVRGFAPGFRRRYKKQVVQDHGIFNVRGLGLINTYTLSLDQVFVDLRINPPDPRKFNLNPVASKELEGNRPIWDFLRAVKSDGRIATALAVIGPPGCGKTTLLQHVAVTLATNRQRRHKARAYTPVLLFLRDHVRAITREHPPPLGKLVQDYFGDAGLFATLKPRPGWFEREIEGGRCMVLLDGLDEVADAEERRAVSAWVDTQIKNYVRCPFVLTARPQGYADAPLQRAHVLEVQPFNARQVRRFVENWYLANEAVASGGREDEGVRARAGKDAADLLRRLQTLPSLAALTVNPLLLTMIAMVHRYHGALPGSRVELYAEICEVLLGRWRQARGVHDSLKTGQKLVVLRPLAAHMMDYRIRDITTAEAVSIIAEPLKLVGVTSGEAVKQFLNDLQSGSGLLLEREAGQWSFAHLTFQEYLTAAHWLEHRIIDHNWRILVGDSWWHETLRLYAAQGDATPLVRTCLEVDSVDALALAADFLEEARQLLPEIRRAADRRLIEDLEATDPARRRLAAEVKLTRRLRNLQRIDDQREIDLGYITYAEYQLFIDDILRLGGYVQPYHWPGLKFREGTACDPACGMTYEDARIFCSWLGRYGGGSYRLPTDEEARQYSGDKTELSTWCEGPSLIGMSPETEQSVHRQLTARFQQIALPHPVNKILSAISQSTIITALDTANIRAMSDTLDRAIIHDGDATFPRSRLIATDINRVRDLTEALDKTDNYTHAGIVARTLKNALDYARARMREYTIGAILNGSLYCQLDYDGEVAPILIAIDNDDVTEAYRLLQIVQSNIGKPVPQFVELQDALIASAAVRTSARRALRNYLIRMLEESLRRGGASFEIEAPLSWLERILGVQKKAIQLEGNIQQVLNVYWWLRMVMEREEGRLPSWEGIRIVRANLTTEMNVGVTWTYVRTQMES